MIFSCIYVTETLSRNSKKLLSMLEQRRQQEIWVNNKIELINLVILSWKHSYLQQWVTLFFIHR